MSSNLGAPRWSFDEMLNTVMMTQPMRFPKKQKVRKNYNISLPWNTEAIKVIKEKIAHYKAMNNTRKLAIYEAKLKQKLSLVGMAKAVIRAD